MEVVCVMTSGPTFKILVAGRLVSFEWHPQCGPTVLNKYGDPANKQPVTRDPFWRAVRLWDKQGRKMYDSGICIWVEPPPERVMVRRIGKRTLLQHNKDCDCGKCELFEFPAD